MRLQARNPRVGSYKSGILPHTPTRALFQYYGYLMRDPFMVPLDLRYTSGMIGSLISCRGGAGGAILVKTDSWLSKNIIMSLSKMSLKY